MFGVYIRMLTRKKCTEFVRLEDLTAASTKAICLLGCCAV
jgi:hypothetical protein